MTSIVVYFIVAFINVFFHITKGILVIKSNKLIASISNCVCYTFSAVVIKFISEVDLTTAIIVQSVTNFLGCWIGMWFCDKILKHNEKEINL